MTKISDLKDANLLGRVRVIHVEKSALQNDGTRWREESRVPIITILYNNKGYIVKEVSYSADGAISQVGFRKYDSSGNKLKVEFNNPNGGLMSLLECEYDENGKEVGCVYTSAIGLISRQRSISEYDDTGRKVGESWFFEDGTHSRKYTYKYYKDGSVHEQLISKYADDGSLEERRITLYSDLGNVIETFCLDALGQLIEGKTKYNHDERGNETEVTSFDTQGSLYSKSLYSYELDAVGNWIRRTEEYKTARTGFESRSITHRTLSYY